MKPTFRNKILQSQFDEQGYLIVKSPDNFNYEQIKKELNRFQPSDSYQGNQDTKIGKQSFHVTFFDNNALYKKQIYSYVQNLFSEFAKEIFSEHKCCQANVFLKLPGSGYVYPHQNLTIVDEDEYTSLSCWMPLQDTNFENGTVCLIPKSHHHFQKYRNTNIFWPYVDFFKSGFGLDYFIPINVNKGEVLIIHDKIVHYTPLNNSNVERWVVHSLWVPREAPLKFYNVNQTSVDIYDVEDNYWQVAEPLTIPEKKYFKNKIDLKQHHYSQAELLQLLEELKKPTV